MIHYHGTPLSPISALLTMAGKHFCVSYARPDDAERCLQIAQSIMYDNGAFSAYSKGYELDLKGYCVWLESRLGHPHWAIIPDVIDGTEEDNYNMIKQWPHRKDLSAVVWHMADSIDYLHKLIDSEFPKICFGSSGEYWKVGSQKWIERCDEAFNSIAKNGQVPYIHMLRGLNMAGKRWPFASADSVNVARNFKDNTRNPEKMARAIDSVQTPVLWNPTLTCPVQKDLL